MDTTHYRKRTAQDWTRSLVRHDFDTFGTLKFNNGRSVGQQTATKLVGAYWHKVDRMFFGKAADKGLGVERWCFTEYGADGNNLHVHFVAQAPIQVHCFCTILNALWVNFNRSTADYSNNWITPITHKEKAIAYTVKGTRFQNIDAICQLASHTNVSGTINTGLDTQAQNQRINNRLTYQQLEKASEQLQRHILETEKRQARRARLAQCGR